MFSKIKELADKYNVSIVIVGTAVVISTLFGECSVDYTSGDVEIKTSPVEAIQNLSKDVEQEAND